MNARETVLEEVVFLLEAGESPNRAAEALGIKPESVARSLQRSGRHDLAARFDRTRRVEASHPCMDCHAPVKSPEAPRCRPCGYVERERRKHAGATHCPRRGCRRYLDEHTNRCRTHGRQEVAA